MRGRNFPKQADANAFRTKTENSLREDSYVSTDVAALTVADAVQAWLNSKKRPGEASRATYRDRIDNYVLPRWGSTRLNAVKRPHIDLWVSELRDGTAQRKDGMQGAQRPLKPATIDAILVPFNAGMRLAVSEGWIRRNPASGVETPRIEREPVIYLDYPQWGSCPTMAHDVRAF